MENFHDDQTLQEMKKSYPNSINYPVYAENRVRFFVNENDWLDFLKTRDLVFGARMHGNIAAVIAGTPSLMITKDIRMRELAKFHGLTAVDENDLCQYKDIWEILESVDFHSPERLQRKNFENYLQFLHHNGLETIFDDDITRVDAPLDQMIAESGVHNEFKPAVLCTTEELADRINTSMKFLKSKKDKLKNEKDKLKNEKDKLKNEKDKLNESCCELEKNIKILEKKCKEYEIILNSRFIRQMVKIKKRIWSLKKN